MEGSRCAAVAAVDVDARDCQVGLVRSQEEEAILTVLGKAYHPVVSDEAEKDGDGALDEEHPAPATEAAAAIEVVESKISDGSGSQDDDFA